jgi:hypothetical protein
MRCALLKRALGYEGQFRVVGRHPGNHWLSSIAEPVVSRRYLQLASKHGKSC